MDFTTGSRGALQAGVCKIFLYFNQSVFTLDPIPLTAIRVLNSTIPAYVKNGSVLEITIPSDVTITNNFPVEITITLSAGIQVDSALNVNSFLNSGPRKGAPSADRLAGTNEYSAKTSAETTSENFIGNPLPVELAHFNVVFSEDRQQPKLSWIIMTEKENYGFIL